MMVSVLIFTVVGSCVSSLVPSTTMGNFSVFMTFLGIKFIVRPVMTTKEAMESVSAKKRAIQSVVCGVLIGYMRLHRCWRRYDDVTYSYFRTWI